MPARPYKRSKGFRQTGALVEARVRKATEGRGFAVSRLLTQWEEIAGRELAPLCRPLKVGYGRSIGATLTVLTNGANAPVLEMQKEALRNRVNACYGYNAISRIAITQTAPDGLSLEAPKPAKPVPAKPDPTSLEKASGYADGVADDQLRSALEVLAANVLTRSARRARSN